MTHLAPREAFGEAFTMTFERSVLLCGKELIELLLVRRVCGLG